MTPRGVTMPVQSLPSEPFRRFTSQDLEQSIPARFEQIAAERPSAVAVLTPAGATTYAELDAAANRVAHALLDRRGPGEEPVLILLDQGPTLIAGILGALKAGKIYVPGEASMPLARLADMAEAAPAAAVLTQARHAALAGALSAGERVVIVVDGLDAATPSASPRLALGPERRAYIYYTSGSTGRPKGVFDIHRNVLHNVMRYTNALHVGPSDRLTLLQSASFSGAVSSMFVPLLNGAAVCPFDVLREGVDRIAPWLRAMGVTIYHSVPSIFRRVAESGLAFPALRLIRLEGDQASLRDVELFRRGFPPRCLLVNGLGATECGIVSQFFLAPGDPLDGPGVPIGYPVEDMEIRVVDERGDAVPAGEVGEIAVRSRYLAAGYWGRPDLTAVTFAVEDAATGLRTYGSGDLGRMRPDGCLEHLGRKDFTLKVRGQRVDVVEVEAALLGVAGVRDAAVTTHPDGAGEARLVGYVVPEAGTAPSVSAIRRALIARLPGDLVPSAFVTLEALPLNANRKVDRRALPPPGRERPALDTPWVAPRTPLETALALIWAQVLELDSVGVLDDFFELGGDSLAAARVATRVRERYAVELDVRDLFANSTVEGVALALLHARLTRAGQGVPGPRGERP